MNGDLSSKVLEQINKYATVETHVLAAALDVDHQAIIGLIKSFQCFDGLIEVEPKSVKKLEVTKDGLQVKWSLFWV